MGDFNRHVNDLSDEDAGNFCDMMSAIGMDQYVSFPVHNTGNTLHLVFTEVGNNLMIWNKRHHLHVYWSDHCNVEFSIPVVKNEMYYPSTGKLLMKIYLEELTTQTNVALLLNIDNLETLVLRMNLIYEISPN